MDKTGNHLHVWTKTGAFNCIVGSSDDANGRLHNRAIREYIYQGANPEFLALLETTIIDPDPSLDADKVYPEEMLGKLSRNHSYWLNRKIDEEVLRVLEGGVVPKDPPSKLSNRYVFPVRDHVSGRIIGWTGRLTSDASFGPKWKHLVKSKRAVYPLWYNKEAIIKARKVVLVESVGDLLACMTAGIHNCLVLFGLNLNSRVFGFLASANLDQIIISTNNDAEKVAPDGRRYFPGQEAAQKVYNKLLPYFGEDRVKVRLPMTAKDWGDVLENGGDELRLFKTELENTEPIPTIDLSSKPSESTQSFSL